MASPSPLAGGGYLSSCTDSGDAATRAAAAPDPRLAELRRMGLSRPWLAAASAIGYDAFMTLWRVLATVDGLDSRDRLVVPKLAGYYRYQRNQLIRAQASTGASVAAIRDAIQRQLGETLSTSHIQRLIDDA